METVLPVESPGRPTQQHPPMDISTAISTDYTTLPPDTRVSKLAGTFEDSSVNGVIVQGDTYEGVVTRRQLVTSHHPPNEKIGSLVWHVPRLAPDDDVRRVAQLMIDSDSQFLPVFDGPEVVGVVTADGILSAVHEYLHAVTVRDAFSEHLVSVRPEASFGEALNILRENRITHLPVLTETSVEGMLSLYDVIQLTVRSTTQSQGGDGGGTDSHGGPISSSAARDRGGGYGAREGELDRMLDLPVRDLMVSPVRTVEPDETLDVAVTEMEAFGGSSLVVVEGETPVGIVTKTDVLDALTWEASGNRAIQIYGTELLDDMSHDEVVSMIEKFDDRDHGRNILDAKIHLHEHKERLRGRPLLLARIRLHTDGGLFIASGEGYGASHAIKDARDVLERQIRDKKTHGKSKKPPDDEYWERRFGSLLKE